MERIAQKLAAGCIEGTNDDPSGHGAVVEIAAKALRDSHLDFFIKYPLEGLKKSGIYRPDFLVYDRHGRFVLWVFHEIEDGIQTQQANVNDETWLSYNGFLEGQSVLITRYPAHQLPKLAIEETVQLIAKSFSMAHA
jgi:hypothetical protein